MNGRNFSSYIAKHSTINSFFCAAWLFTGRRSRTKKNYSERIVERVKRAGCI
jgi:hypothetical protein